MAEVAAGVAVGAEAADSTAASVDAEAQGAALASENTEAPDAGASDGVPEPEAFIDALSGPQTLADVMSGHAPPPVKDPADSDAPSCRPVVSMRPNPLLSTSVTPH